MSERVDVPGKVTLLAFAGVVLGAGLAPIGVKFSLRELPPFYSGGIRFAAASLIFMAIVLIKRVPLPRGRALIGAVLYGFLGFTGFFALAYWALTRLPAGIASLVMASIPLFTFFFAIAHRLESFRWRGLIGSLITIVGIAVLLGAPVGTRVPMVPLLVMLVAAAMGAEAAIVVKKFPPTDPVATNAVATLIGAVTLLLISGIAGERWVVPREVVTWAWLAELVLIGTIGLFMLFLFVLKRWTASGASYQFVLMPVVTVLVAAAFAGERLGAGVALGGLVILAGVYYGALSSKKVPVSQPEASVLAQRCHT
ncbi:MAG TPA: EamA family transporter [Actinomycetota bacterium]|nr:EamA family transporter [Actinomycetota bacterium]